MRLPTFTTIWLLGVSAAAWSRADLSVVASSSFLNPGAPGLINQFSSVTVNSDGAVGFVADLPAEAGQPALFLNQSGRLSLLVRSSDLDQTYSASGSRIDNTAANGSNLDFIAVIRPKLGLGGSECFFQANTPLILLGSDVNLYQWQARGGALAGVSKTGVSSLYSNPTFTLSLYENGARTVVATAVPRTTGAFTSFSDVALDSSGTTIYFIATSTSPAGATVAGVYSWTNGIVSTVITPGSILDGAAALFSLLRVADDGDLILYDAAGLRLVDWHAGTLTTLVKTGTQAVDGTPIDLHLALNGEPSPLLRVDQAYVYFLGARRDTTYPYPPYAADWVFRVDRASGAVELYLDSRAIVPAAVLPATILSGFAMAAPGGPTTSPVVAFVMTAKNNASQQAIYAGSAPFSPLVFPAVPPGYPSLSLADPGDNYVTESASVKNLAVTATGAGPFSYTWSLNGAPIDPASLLYTGASGPQLSLSPFAQSYHSGTYTVAVTNAAGTSYESSSLQVSGMRGQDGSGILPRLTNCSIMGFTAPGQGVLTGGIVLLPRLLSFGYNPVPFETFESGDIKRMLIRAVGPGLLPFGVAAAPATNLTLFSGSGAIASNAGSWNSNPQVAGAAAMVGAFPLTAGSSDSALLVDLAPQAYSVQATAPAGDGAALVEFYEADTVGNIRDLSARAFVSGPDHHSVTIGFVITPTSANQIGQRTVIIRAVGPGLKAFGITHPLSAPILQLYSGSTLVAQNTGYLSAPNASQINPVGTALGAFALDASGADCAIMMDLPPGAYTAQITGPADDAGVVLAEIYTNIGF